MIDFLKIKNDNFPFLTAVAAGQIPGVRYIFKFGTNAEVSNSVYEDIWIAGGVETLLTTAETVDISSDDAEDGVGGDGVRTMRIQGLNAQYHLIEEDVVMNGLTPVTTVNEYLRVYRVYGLISGDTGENEGTITIESTSSSTTMGSIDPGQNQTEKTQFTIPAGYYGFILSIEQSGGQGDDWLQRIRVRDLGLTERTVKSINSSRNQYKSTLEIPIVVKPMSDLKIQAKSTDGGTVSVTANYELLLVKEELVNAQLGSV